MVFTLAEALLFLLPVSAGTWRGLMWRSLAGLALVVLAFGIVTQGRFSLVVAGGDADIGAGIVLFYAIQRLGGGIAARTVSLAAAAAGHRRPWSLWIEVLFYFGTPLLLDRALGI